MLSSRLSYHLLSLSPPFFSFLAFFSDGDCVTDLKLNDLEVVKDYNKLNTLLQKMAQNKCHGCVKLEEHIKLAGELKRHRDEVNALKFQMSDEALQQMPDFQGRVCDDDLAILWQQSDFGMHDLKIRSKQSLFTG